MIAVYCGKFLYLKNLFNMKKKNCPNCIRIDLKEVPENINELIMKEQAALLSQGKKARSKEWFVYRLLERLLPKD